ncbi:FG-GAP repeat domain-containing protein [Paenibacillus sp. HJGM_3]|uniref:FG-GAP repeat domain-containing protein n=1 Tax=Paenibacillus sp. HJGM_3 TaxID=3379816 RepID=UPI00385AF0FD
MRVSKHAVRWLIGLLLVVACLLLLLFGQREERIRLLYATGGPDYDRAAYLNYEQSLVPNVTLNRWPIGELGPSKLRSYDAIVLDPSVAKSPSLQEDIGRLRAYVEAGGHLYVDNELIDVLPLDLLGGTSTVSFADIEKPQFSFPEVDERLQGFQDVFREYASAFVENVITNQLKLKDYMPGLNWGKALVPSTAEPIALLQGQAIATLNRVGAGTVLTASGFLPNRYFITGFDMQSGMNPTMGFAQLTEDHNNDAAYQSTVRANYFNFKTGLELKPFFNFSFAAANHLLRSEYVAFVSKETLGYSFKRVLGPYGRPAMAFQNHFEALPAFEKQEGIVWAELLKGYNEIPSFSLVRSSFDWWRWYEGIVVHLNTGTSAKPEFVGEFPNSFYSSGTHLLSGDKLLYLAGYPIKEGQSTDLQTKLELPYRAYPAIADLDGDGKPDLLAGSADGSISWYRNVGQKPSTQQVPAGTAYPDAFGERQAVRFASGTAERVLRPAGAVTLAAGDLDGDGRADLVLGTADGRVLAALQGPGGAFADPVPLTTPAGTPIAAEADNAAPALGDVDRDGVADLVVGDASGRVTLYRGVKGTPLRFADGEQLFDLPAQYAAPSIRDLDGDGKPDLAVGNHQGDVLVYIQQGTYDTWLPQGPLNGKTMNQIGTKAIVGGQFSVPVWYDLNHDGKDDLIVGQVEYSQPVTIDDPNFPYKQQLQDFLEYTRKNKLELYPHLFMHSYVSDAQEKEEIALHQKAFETLGIPWTLTGTNQHTWRINNTDNLQTLRNENDAGIWFNFGFKPPNDPLEPQYGQDYIWGFPFLLADEKLKQPMLLFTPGKLLPYNSETQKLEGTDLYKGLAKLDMPINYFEHIEYQERPYRLAYFQEFAQFFDRLRTEQDYNFVSEPQMARSMLASLMSDIHVSRSWFAYGLDKLRNKLGNGKHLSLKVKADTSRVPDGMAQEYRDAVGVVFEPGQAYANIPFGTDSDIVTMKDKKIYVGLQGRTSIAVDWKQQPELHIERVNVPVTIDKSRSGWTVGLNSDGMQQIKLFSPDKLRIEGTDLKIDKFEAEGNNVYTITHFGEKTTIQLMRE